MAVPDQWREFVREYRVDRSFWYFPHSHVGTGNLVPKLRVLAGFEGVEWSDAAVTRALRQAGLTKARGVSAGGRMLRKATENLGLCLFDEHSLQLTPAGMALLSGAPEADILERVLWKYQLSNPINRGAVALKVFPHAALLRVMLAVGFRVTRDEFILFVGRTKTDDVRDTVRAIKRWRKLTAAGQDSVIAALRPKFQRRATDTSYILGFHACARYLERYEDPRGRRGIKIVAGQEQTARTLLTQHSEAAVWIDFATKEQCVAVYGDYEETADAEGALDYYIDTSQAGKAVEAFARLPSTARRGRSVQQFRDEIFLEKDLEDYLVGHLDLIERGLRLVKRQRTVAVGVIDILARGRDGNLVVIELKKAQASDKVFGQLCRYMGCVSAHLARGERVRGFIVGSEIDDKLRYAATVVPRRVVQLKRYRRDPGNPRIFVED